jgi:hypothetical protein
MTRRRWLEDCSSYRATGRGCGKARGFEREKTMDAEISWGEVVTALAVIVIIAFLLLTS